MPETPTFVSPLPIVESAIEGCPTLLSPPARPRPPQDLASAQLYTAQTAQPQAPAPVILLPETGGNFGGFVFAVVFVAFCALAAWVGRKEKQ